METEVANVVVESVSSYGMTFALIGAGIASVVSGIGSTLGIALVGKTSTGVVVDKPEHFGKLLVMTALPGTQAIYGFLVAFIVLLVTGVLAGAPVELTTIQGLEIIAACLPVAIGGFFSALYQGRVAAGGVLALAKDGSLVGKCIVLAAMVETQAILVFLISALALFFMKF